jgi:hypothetical protein
MDGVDGLMSARQSEVGACWQQEDVASSRAAAAVSMPRIPSFASGGDEHSLHVADVENTKDHGCLVVRSYAPGDWPAQKEPLPEWLKSDEAKKKMTSEQEADRSR